jgi:tetratricopeptide (TPR) repeat protein
MRTKLAITLSLLILAVPCWAIPDASGKVAGPTPDISADAPMSARLNYNLGLEQFEKAQAEEKLLAGLKGAKAKAALQKVMDGYRAARTRMEAAVEADPNMKEGWNLVGYTSRRLGEFDRSLEAYDKALALNPTYSEAIEYRAEAYLSLNRLEDVKTAYLALFAVSPTHAQVLVNSMQAWVTAHRKSAAGVAPGDIDAFAQWVQERASMAKQTAAVRGDIKAPIQHAWN